MPLNGKMINSYKIKIFPLHEISEITLYEWVTLNEKFLLNIIKLFFLVVNGNKFIVHDWLFKTFQHRCRIWIQCLQKVYKMNDICIKYF